MRDRFLMWIAIISIVVVLYLGPWVPPPRRHEIKAW